MADVHNGELRHVDNRDLERMGRFLKQPRPYEHTPSLVGHLDSNAELIHAVAQLYIPDGANVLDLTIGKGAFWKLVDLTRFTLYGNDLKRYTDRELAGFQQMGVHQILHESYYGTRWAPHQFDVTVFDPPYRSGGSTSHEAMVETYGLTHLDTDDTKSGHGNASKVWDEYMLGLNEAWRVTMPKGFILIKCQDFVESGRQHWFHVELYRWAVDQGAKVKDLFTLTQTRRPMMRHKSQHHARKNVSYLWVIQKW
jgi:hypothetical protein